MTTPAAPRTVASRRGVLGWLLRSGAGLALALALGPVDPVLARGKGGGRTIRLYRANGRYAGRIEPNGRYYDASGRYVGRVEGQRMYDAKGRYLGRYEESGAYRTLNGDELSEHPLRAPATAGAAGAVGEPPADRVQSPSADLPRHDLIRIVPDNGRD